MQGLHNESVDRLFDGILKLQTREECYAFFEDVCTIKEIMDMSQRLDAAFMLTSGANYQEISKKIGISTATISRVSRCLQYGSGGYPTVIGRLTEENAEKAEGEGENKNG